MCILHNTLRDAKTPYTERYHQLKAKYMELEIHFSGEDYRINLNEKESKIFTDSSPYIESITDDLVKVVPDFFSLEKKVPDVFRYVIRKEKDKWTLLDSNSKKIDGFSINLDIEIIKEPSKNIILILESPHKDEFEIKAGKLVAKKPAAGDSGKNIFKYFASYVLPILESNGLELTQNEYNLCIVNPVPYQTSLINVHQEGLVSTLRDKVWKTLYPHCKKDFKERIDQYLPIVILNACTSKLKSELDEELSEFPKERLFNTSHPASWQISLGPFKSGR